MDALDSGKTSNACVFLVAMIALFSFALTIVATFS